MKAIVSKKLEKALPNTSAQFYRKLDIYFDEQGKDIDAESMLMGVDELMLVLDIDYSELKSLIKSLFPILSWERDEKAMKVNVNLANPYRN